MLHAAYKVGITEIVCTPHCRDPYFDFEGMWDAFDQLRRRSPIPLRMGFEVNIRKLRELGMDWAPQLCFQDSSVLLLELSTHATKRDFEDYEREIYELQGMGHRRYHRPSRALQGHPGGYLHCGAPGRAAGACCRRRRTSFAAGAMGKERKPALNVCSRPACTPTSLAMPTASSIMRHTRRPCRNSDRSFDRCRNALS